MEAMLSDVTRPSIAASTVPSTAASAAASTVPSTAGTTRCRLRGITRTEAVAPYCQRGRPCRWNGTSAAWSEEEVYHRYEGSSTRKFNEVMAFRLLLIASDPFSSAGPF